MSEVESFVQQTLARLRPLHRAYLTQAAPESAQAREAYYQFWDDSAQYVRARRMYEASAACDARTARRLRLICMSAEAYRSDAGS